MYDEVKPIQEMLDTGAFFPFKSPWGSAMVLVCKKGGKLCICIGVWHLNAWTVCDVHSLPRIYGTVDCLNGAV